MPDTAIRLRPTRSVKRLHERDGKARRGLDYCGVTRCYLNSTLTRRLRNITYQRETRRGPVSRSNNFICRAMRALIDLDRLGERTLWVDCDVLEADGGTRTAAITGGSICRLALIVAFSAAGIRDCFLCIVDREYPLVRRTLQPHRRQSALFQWNFNPERELLRANAAWPRHRAAKTRANDAEDRGQISAMASDSPFIPGEME